MKKQEIHSFAGLIGIRVSKEDLKELQHNTAFQRQEQGLFDWLDQLYDAIVKGGLDEKQTEYIRGQIQAIRFVLQLPEFIEGQVIGDEVQPVKYTEDEIAETEDFVRRRYNPEEG